MVRVEGGKYLTDTATTGAVAGNTADVTFTPPAGKRYVFDYLTVAVDATNNKIRVYNKLGATEHLIWEELTNVTSETVIDLATKYPASLQVIEPDCIIVRCETTEAVAKTVTAKVWIVQGG